MRKVLAITILLFLLAIPVISVSSNTIRKNTFRSAEDSIPILRVNLANGTNINFTTIDSFLELIYSGKISYKIISNISVIPFDRYNEIIKSNITLTQEDYVNALKIFYARLSEQPKNYSGYIVPVNETEYLYDEGIAERISRIVAYGKISSFVIEFLQGNTSIIKDFVGGSFNITIVVYTQIENIDILNSLISTYAQIINKTDSKVAVLFVDTTNNVSALNISDIEIPENMFLVNDANTSINENANGTYNYFTLLNESLVVPLIIAFDSNGVVWYKHLGEPNIDELMLYVEMYLEDGIESIPVYPILDIVAEEPTAGELCKIMVLLGEGFGEIYNITLFYEVLGKDNKTLYKDSVKIPVDTYSFTIQKLQDDARYLVVNATVYSEYGKFESGQYVFKVKYKPPEEQVLPAWIYDAIIWAVILIIVIAIGAIVYRKYFKED